MSDIDIIILWSNYIRIIVEIVDSVIVLVINFKIVRFIRDSILNV